MTQVPKVLRVIKATLVLQVKMAFKLKLIPIKMVSSAMTNFVQHCVQMPISIKMAK